MKAIKHIIILVLLTSSACIQADYVVSHKTAGLEFPENTYQGFVASLSMPIDAIEFDIHVTKDKHLVLHHDPVLSSYNCYEKASKKKIVIAQTTLADLEAITCFNHKVKQPYQLPRLSNILMAYLQSDQSKDLLVEIKVWDELIENNPLHKELDTQTMHYSHSEVAQLVYAQIREHGIKRNIIFNSFSRELLLELKALQSSDEQFEYGLLYKGDYSPWKLGLIALFSTYECYDSCWAPNYKEVKKWLEENKIEYFIPNFSQLNNILFRWGYRRHIAEQTQSFDIIPWTLNAEDDWDKYRRGAFYGVITDKPSAYMKLK